jgi:hypothetical protein
MLHTTDGGATWAAENSWLDGSIGGIACRRVLTARRAQANALPRKATSAGATLRKVAASWPPGS